MSLGQSLSTYSFPFFPHSTVFNRYIVKLGAANFEPHFTAGDRDCAVEMVADGDVIFHIGTTKPKNNLREGVCYSGAPQPRYFIVPAGMTLYVRWIGEDREVKGSIRAWELS